MVSISLKEDVPEITCSVEIIQGEWVKKNLLCDLSICREWSGLGNSTALCLAWQVSISLIWGIILYSMCMCLATWYEDIGSSIYYSL